MAHLHNSPGDYDLTVSGYIINVEDPETPKLLLHKHKSIHKLMQPGGHVEQSETPWAALARELLEETGYGLIDLNYLSTPGVLKIKLPNPTIRVTPSPFFVNTHPMDNGLLAHYHTDMSFAFTVDHAPKYVVHGDESTVFRLVTLEEIDLIPADEITSTAKTVGKAVLEAYINGNLIPTEKPYRT